MSALRAGSDPLGVNDHHLAASVVGLHHAVRLTDLLEAEYPGRLNVEPAGRSIRRDRRELGPRQIGLDQASDRWQPGGGIPPRYAVTGPVSAMPGNSSGDTRRAATISRLSSRNSGS